VSAADRAHRSQARPRHADIEYARSPQIPAIGMLSVAQGKYLDVMLHREPRYQREQHRDDPAFAATIDAPGNYERYSHLAAWGHCVYPLES
jgi:hypothetical protein